MKKYILGLAILGSLFVGSVTYAQIETITVQPNVKTSYLDVKGITGGKIWIYDTESLTTPVYGTALTVGSHTAYATALPTGDSFVYLGYTGTNDCSALSYSACVTEISTDTVNNGAFYKNQTGGSIFNDTYFGSIISTFGSAVSDNIGIVLTFAGLMIVLFFFIALVKRGLHGR